jgi:hypothetical protein
VTGQGVSPLLGALGAIISTHPRDPRLRTTPSAEHARGMIEKPPFDLVMSSGFLCFSSHCGMLRALEASGTTPSAYVGTSSGALAAAMAAAGLSADDVARELGGQRPISLCRPAWPSASGIMSTRALLSKLRTVLPPTFAELPTPLAVGVYRVPGSNYGVPYLDPSPLLVTSGDLPAAVAASCAVPRLFKPLPLTGKGSSSGTALNVRDQSAIRCSCDCPPLSVADLHETAFAMLELRWRATFSGPTSHCPASTTCRYRASRLVSSHLISSRLVSSHLVSSRLISSRLV